MLLPTCLLAQAATLESGAAMGLLTLLVNNNTFGQVGVLALSRALQSASGAGVEVLQLATLTISLRNVSWPGSRPADLRIQTHNLRIQTHNLRIQTRRAAASWTLFPAFSEASCHVALQRTALLDADYLLRMRTTYYLLSITYDLLLTTYYLLLFAAHYGLLGCLTH